MPLERRNAEGGALTIDTITADGDDDDDDDEIEIDLDDMPGTLDDYEDAYLESPSWERSITDEEQERVRRRGASRRNSGFGEGGGEFGLTVRHDVRLGTEQKSVEKGAAYLSKSKPGRHHARTDGVVTLRIFRSWDVSSSPRARAGIAGASRPPLPPTAVSPRALRFSPRAFTV